MRLFPLALTGCLFGSPDRDTLVDEHLASLGLDRTDLLDCGQVEIGAECASEPWPDLGRCMLDAWVTCIPAIATIARSTAEGAPLVDVWLVHPDGADCVATRFEDTSADDLAEDPGIGQYVCRDLDRGSSDACEPLTADCALVDRW